MRPSHLTTIGSVALLVIFAAVAGAQAPVNGIVTDSIARRPLAGATVQLVAAGDPARFSRSATSDSLGRFAFADVPDGHYTIGFFHPALDSLGISAPARDVFVSGRRAVRADVAIPGPRRLVAAICGARVKNDSGGALVGVIRDARTRAPISRASVAGEWMDLTFSAKGIGRRNPRIVATTGDNGWFALCNVPSGGSMLLSAKRDADSTDRLEIELPPEGFARRDLFLPSGAHDGRLSGVVVTSANATPLSGAQVSVAGVQARANERGNWVIGDAPLGTRVLEVRAVGYYPERRVVDVVDSAPPLRVALSTMKAVLDTVKVSATRSYSRNLAVFETNRRSGTGAYVTAEQIKRRRLVRLTDLFRTMNGIRVDRNRNDSSSIQVRGAGDRFDRPDDWCTPTIWIDGKFFHDIDADQVDELVRPEEVVGIELYAGIIVPPQYQTPLGGCGALVIWTR